MNAYVNFSPAMLAVLDPEAVRGILELPVHVQAQLRWKWRGWLARPNQLAPEGDWGTWLVLAGRGYGKTRTGAEWVREKWQKGAKRIALVAETSADARDVLVEGPSGILAISPKNERPLYEPSKRRLTWPNGAVATLYNGTEPDQLRGPEHDTALVDELAKYKYADDTMANLRMGLRVGLHPQACITTTPRPIPIVRELIRDPATVVTRGSTFDNAANLPSTFLNDIKNRYGNTRLGRQELYAEVLSDVPGALWLAKDILSGPAPASGYKRIVVGVDPSGASGDPEEGNNSIGIVVAALGMDNLFYVLEDATCCLGPSGWARAAVNAYHKHGADRIVAEGNFGGAMVEATIRTADKNVPVKIVTASRGKAIRAEPIAALYEQHRVTHVPPPRRLDDYTSHFGDLETQMSMMTTSGYIGDGSPDRVDALVWALTELSGGKSAPGFVPSQQSLSRPSQWRP